MIFAVTRGVRVLGKGATGTSPHPYRPQYRHGARLLMPANNDSGDNV